VETMRWPAKRRNARNTRSAKNTRYAVAGSAAAAVLVAAAAVVTPTAAAVTPAASPVPDSPPAPVLRWHACQGSFQCTTARVPLDYRHPHGKTITIAVIRHRATDPAHRLGSLFFNSGGPFQQIRPFLASYQQIPATLRARYDIISFDPRGFGFSTRIRCFPTLAAEHKFLAGTPLFPAGRRQERAWERTAIRFDAVCARHGGSLLRHDSSADTARDMDLLRRAVGDPVLNYLGQSYGTGLAAVYANLFPRRTGHMVLDGNLNPVAWTHGGRALSTDLRDREDVADAQTMRAFLRLCGKAPTSACAFSAGTPAATSAKFATLLRRLRHRPATFGNPPQTWTYADVVTDFPEYEFTVWPADAALLQQLWLASAAGDHQPPGKPPMTLPLLDPIVASACADSPEPRDPRAYEAAAKLAFQRSGAFGLMATWNGALCMRWPRAAAQDRYTGPWHRRTASTLLLIGNTVDPSTPYWNSVAMSHDLARARLLTVKGYGHTEFTNPSTCAIKDEVRYFTTGALPPPGTVCPQDGTPFGVASP
jgi:pimeloyl-ACP methyl ester carboxylesterase